MQSTPLFHQRSSYLFSLPNQQLWIYHQQGYFPTLLLLRANFHPLSIEQMFSKLNTKILSLESELAAAQQKLVVPTPTNDGLILATAIDKINTFIENADTWNKKLDELKEKTNRIVPVTDR